MILYRSLLDTDLIEAAEIYTYFDNFRLRKAFAYQTNQNKGCWCPGDSRSQDRQDTNIPTLPVPEIKALSLIKLHTSGGRQNM